MFTQDIETARCIRRVCLGLSVATLTRLNVSTWFAGRSCKIWLIWNTWNREYWLFTIIINGNAFIHKEYQWAFQSSLHL